MQQQHYATLPVVDVVERQVQHIHDGARGEARGLRLWVRAAKSCTTTPPSPTAPVTTSTATTASTPTTVTVTTSAMQGAHLPAAARSRLQRLPEHHFLADG